MSDIDYEQLDKEVGQVMMKSPDETAAPEASEMHAGPKPAPVRPRGRYMDMVRPLSDMRPASKQFFPPKAKSPTLQMVNKPKAAEKPRMVMERLPSMMMKKPEVADRKPEPEIDLPEFGVIEDVVSDKTVAARSVERPIPADGADFIEMGEDFEAPDGNNYSLGGRSPFIPNAQVEKRPLGSFVPEGSTRAVGSTRNTYSSRAPMNEEKAEVEQTMVVNTKKKSGLVWLLLILGVIVVGGALGMILYFFFAGN